VRILHLYKDYPPVYGGIEHHIQMLSETQAAAGHNVTVLVTNPGRLPGQEMVNGVKVVRAPRLATIASTPLTFHFIPYLRKNSVDIAHLHFPYPVGELSERFAGGGHPYLISYHSDVVNPRQQGILRFYKPLMDQVLRKAGRILVTSQNYLESSATLQRYANRCTVVPLGIDPRPYLHAVSLKPPSQRPVILFLGRHRYYKGVEVLIESVRGLAVELRIAGDGPMRLEWERSAAVLGDAVHIRFLGDLQPSDLPGIYAGADVFVLPSTLRAEAFGIVLLEAMAAGLPCVTTELGTGTSFIVRHGETGLVVPPGDPQALSEAIRLLIADPQLSRRMGEAGRERVMREFTLERMAERVEIVYKGVLDNGE
jgi:rhamnosyl/mannosyltransferase